MPDIRRSTSWSHWPLRRRILLATVAVGMLATACSSLLGPRTVEISRAELQTKLGKQFPMTKRVMKLLDVNAGLPVLDLRDTQNRVALSIDLTAKELIMGQEYKGKVALSFGLRYEPKDLTIRLVQPKVEQVMVDGLPPLYQTALSNMGARLAEESLQDYAIHQFKPEDLRAADRMGYEVKDIQVTTTGLAIHLAPRP